MLERSEGTKRCADIVGSASEVERDARRAQGVLDIVGALDLQRRCGNQLVRRTGPVHVDQHPITREISAVGAPLGADRHDAHAPRAQRCDDLVE